MSTVLHGLYVITQDRPTGVGRLADRVEAALRGGARVVQYRDKSADHVRRRAEAGALNELCQQHGVPLLINDDVDLAVRIDAAGVHLGRDDVDLRQARDLLGPHRTIGVSCYNSFELARAAAAAGADYVAFGSFFASPTKPNALRATPSLLRRARLELDLPTVAIGGISPENGASLVRAGADMLAVISAVFAASDVTAAAHAFSRCFRPIQETRS